VTRGRARSAVLVVTTMAAFLVVWEAAVALLQVPHFILPPPSAVLQKAGSDLASGVILPHLWQTLQEILIGFAAAAVTGTGLGTAIALVPALRQTLYPFVVASQTIPKIAIAPLFIIWFGFGFAPKLLLVFLLSFFPIVVASIAGFKSVDPEIMDFARTTGAGGWKMFAKIRLPQALPDIFTGLKVGAALSATAAVVAEFVASDKGLGYLLLQYNGNLDTPMVFAIIVLLSLIGVAVYYVVEIIERFTIPWHVSQQPSGVAIT
jgi:NitT/TauT family transport system permease protein